MRGKRSKRGDEQCHKVLATGGGLTEGGRIYEQEEEWTEKDKIIEKRNSTVMLVAS